MCLFSNRQVKNPSTDLGFQRPLVKNVSLAPTFNHSEDDSQTLWRGKIQLPLACKSLNVSSYTILSFRLVSLLKKQETFPDYSLPLRLAVKTLSCSVFLFGPKSQSLLISPQMVIPFRKSGIFVCYRI